MININPILNFNIPMILATASSGTLPESVRGRLTPAEQTRLLEIIVGFEQNPTNLRDKEGKYPELMKLYYKGIGLEQDGRGSIPPDQQNHRAAFELADLINDAILQDQQNIKGVYSPDQLQAALKLQDKLREDLERTDFDRLLRIEGGSGSDSTMSGDQKQYQTEKITSYLAANKEEFRTIFEHLARDGRVDTLTESQKEKFANLKKLSDGNNAKTILDTILSTFNDFKQFSFTDDSLTKMKCTDNAPLLSQATGTSAFGNWITVAGSSGRSMSEGDGDGSSSSRSTRESREISRLNRLCERLLARLEENDPSNNTGNRGNRWNNNSNNCNCANCNGGNNCNCNNGNNGNNGNNDIPSWVRDIGFGLNLAGQFLTITGLGNNNQNGGRYPPPTPIPYYVGGDTWPWGRTNGINGDEYSASNNYMPSSVSSNPYSTASAYNPVNVTVNPVFNNNPYMASNSSALSSAPSSNSYELSRGFFGIC